MAEEFLIMDFDADSVLHDAAWLATRPNGEIVTIVQPKTDSIADDMSLAIGEGRFGGNCLKVTAQTSAMKGPAVFFSKFRVQNGLGANMTDDDRGYFLPRGKRANRFSF